MKHFFLLFLVIFSCPSLGQVRTLTTFPILSDGQKTQWKEYDRAKNVKIENKNSFSFDLNGNHYKVAAYSKGVKTYKEILSDITKNKGDKDSVDSTKVFLLPSDYMEKKVIAVQISYIYNKTSRKLKELRMIPLMFFKTIQDARKEYHIAR
ncbi:MAG: hypothetical protein M3O71_04790 [Bacteroidota bacterium]|nr:hypothetical protein [Bacteroidota bacterium]